MKIDNCWQLNQAIGAISFDCDGTLSAIEGIDALAEMNQVGPIVAKMKEKAMAESGLSVELYRQRLELVKPTTQQIAQLSKAYLAHVSPESQAVIALFQALKKPVYLLSAGIYQAVASFGKELGIPESNIYAVKLFFDSGGNYCGFDQSNPLTSNDGKKQIGDHLKKQHGRLIHIGDGLNDFSMRTSLVRFIGYGGFFYREKVAEQCDFYIKTPSMAAILPLCLTKDEVKQLNKEQVILYQQGLELLNLTYS